MKKILLIVNGLLGTSILTLAQDIPSYQRYMFSTNTESYSHLGASAIDITPAPSDEEPFWTYFESEAISLPFVFKYQNADVHSLAIGASGEVIFNGTFSDSDMSHLSGLNTFYSGAPSRGKILYEITGTTGSRIFKYEFQNVATYSNFTGNDTLNFQVWLHEGSNIIEYRAGYSNIPEIHFADGYIDLMSSDEILMLTAGLISTEVDDIPSLEDEPIAYAHLVKEVGTTYADTLLHVSGMDIDDDDIESYGIYDIILLDAYPAEGTVFRFTPLDGTSGLQSIASSKMHLYPNPAQGTLNVDITGIDARVARYTVYDLYGRSLLSGNFQSSVQAIDIQSLSSGQYFLKITTENHEGFKTFIKN